MKLCSTETCARSTQTSSYIPGSWSSPRIVLCFVKICWSNSLHVCGAIMCKWKRRLTCNERRVNTCWCHRKADWVQRDRSHTCKSLWALQDFWSDYFQSWTRLSQVYGSIDWNSRVLCTAKRYTNRALGLATNYHAHIVLCSEARLLISTICAFL